uniref:TSA: Wollemia nobilis Ref_Wollemi_Transcript_6864_1379 transcribed RNA sequence n=1 Tax=Wollemia nobilis TaxID=56998 RepID=A0A0C9QVA6_9CONI
MKGVDIFCASPASTAICLSLDQRALARQGSRVLEQSRLLERQGSRGFEPSNLVLDPGRRSKSERPRKSTDHRRRSTSNNNHNHNSNSNNVDESPRESVEQKPRRSRHRSSAANSLSRFSCSTIDQSAIIPFQQPRPSKPVKAPPIIDKDPASPSSSSSPGATEVVVLRVSLHCKGCAGKVDKHLKKMEGVTSFNIDLPKQKVTVVGNVTPVGVLESVSRVKYAEFWPSSKNN